MEYKIYAILSGKLVINRIIGVPGVNGFDPATIKNCKEMPCYVQVGWYWDAEINEWLTPDFVPYSALMNEVRAVGNGLTVDEIDNILEGLESFANNKDES